MAIDLDHAFEIFEASTDFTVGLEEELILVDPDTLMPVDAIEWLLTRFRVTVASRPSSGHRSSSSARTFA